MAETRRDGRRDVLRVERGTAERVERPARRFDGWIKKRFDAPRRHVVRRVRGRVAVHRLRAVRDGGAEHVPHRDAVRQGARGGPVG